MCGNGEKDEKDCVGRGGCRNSCKIGEEVEVEVEAEGKMRWFLIEVYVCGRHPRRHRECRGLDICDKRCIRAKDGGRKGWIRLGVRNEFFWIDK